MAENSKIEWTDHTVNLWWGCSKVHTGCKNCYAEKLSERFGNNIWGENVGRKRIKSAFNDLKKYEELANKKGVKQKIFVGSMMDIFERSKDVINPKVRNETTGKLRNKLFARITVGHYPNLIFLFLTKRPENVFSFIPQSWLTNMPKNIWFGFSVSDQKTYDDLNQTASEHGSNVLWDLKQMSAKIFISVEPQVGEIQLKLFRSTKPDWVIQGGESGPGKRPFDLHWADVMRIQCARADIPYFFKQIDKVQSIPNDYLFQQFPNELR